MRLPANRPVFVLAVFLCVLVLATAAGCGGDEEESGTAATEAAGGTATTADAASGETATTEGAAGDASAGGPDVLTAEQEEGAIDIAQAYFVAKTDFTSDQFDWTLEAAAVDDTGQLWARVSAAPKDDMSLEIEQIYVYSPADSGFWFAHDMGTGIDPATDESFPEEVRDQL